jgi:hypothetical protein
MNTNPAPIGGKRALRGLSIPFLLAAVAACLLVIAKEHAIGGGGLLHYGMRAVMVALCLNLWFLTQKMIGTREAKDGEISDILHARTARLHRYIAAHPRVANAILIGSSAFIDGFGLFLILWSILGPSLRPFAALFILFALRQLCQGACALPKPPGMVWRNPGFPSLFVTYDVGNDFFFSGHTAVAMLGAIELARISPWLGAAV